MLCIAASENRRSEDKITELYISASSISRVIGQEWLSENHESLTHARAEFDLLKLQVCKLLREN